MNPLCFFAHVALATDPRSLSRPQMTANVLVEIDNQTLISSNEKGQPRFSTLSDIQKVDFASEIGRTAVLDYLNSEDEFSELPARQFIDFKLSEMPSYLSCRPAPSRIMPNRSKIWRLVESEFDKLRVRPLSHASVIAGIAPDEERSRKS